MVYTRFCRLSSLNFTYTMFDETNNPAANPGADAPAETPAETPTEGGAENTEGQA